MKYFVPIFVLLLCASCTILGPMESTNRYPILNYFHRYSNVKSSARVTSDFAILKRSVEFDLARVKDGIKIQCMVTTGLNEGPLENVILIGLDEFDVKLNFVGLEHKEYVEHVQESSTTSVASMSTITDPGGTDIVVDDKGNQKTVTRPTSTKTVRTQTPQTTYYEKKKTQYFNSCIIIIPNEQVNMIAQSEKIFFTFQTAKATIRVIPSRRQMQDLRNLFRVDVSYIF